MFSLELISFLQHFWGLTYLLDNLNLAWEMLISNLIGIIHFLTILLHKFIGLVVCSLWVVYLLAWFIWPILLRSDLAISPSRIWSHLVWIIGFSVLRHVLSLIWFSLTLILYVLLGFQTFKAWFNGMGSPKLICKCVSFWIVR